MFIACTVYLLIGLSLSILTYTIGNKLDEFYFDGFGSFVVVTCVVTPFWVLLLPIAIVAAILFAIYWAVCTYITHDDFENPFE